MIISAPAPSSAEYPMSHHPLARLSACFATGLLIAAVALIAVDRLAPIEPALKVAWLWLGGNAAVALAHVIPAILRA